MDAKKKNHKRGRPTVFTEDVIHKLEYAYSIGGTDKDAAIYADISATALYNYIASHPDFKGRRDLLKRKPILKAKIASDKLIESGDPVHVRWYLEHAAAEEYSTKQAININAAGTLSIEDRTSALQAFLSDFNGSSGD